MVLVKCWLVVLLPKLDLKLFQVVEAQAVPDADFSTVKSPNPENQAAFALAEELGRQVDADVLVQLTQMLTALVLKSVNQMVLTSTFQVTKSELSLLNTSLEAHKTAGTLPANAALCKSIVSTELVTKIAESYGATMFNVLTGFKFIGEKIHEFEEHNTNTYMMGLKKASVT